MPTATVSAPRTLNFQGIEVPEQSLNPTAFFDLTRRHRNSEYNKPFAGLGFTDTVELNKSDIIAGAQIRLVGQIVVALNGGAAATTMRWPYDLPYITFQANGQTNLINASGCKLKAREFMADVRLDDKGVAQTVGAGTVNSGTLSLASEVWGVGPGAVLASGTYPFELTWRLPVAEDLSDLSGAIFAQTDTNDLSINLAWSQLSTLFTLTGGATVAMAATLIVETEKYSIPVVGGNFVVPDLSMFHGFVQARNSNALSVGDNDVKLSGQGAGKTLLRCLYQVWNGAAPAGQVPIAMNGANFGPQSWRYGSSEQPETYADGMSLRHINEREYGVDIANVWGFGCHEFAVTNAFRDTVDEGQTSELRLGIYVQNAVALNAPVVEYVSETIFSAGS